MVATDQSRCSFHIFGRPLILLKEVFLAALVIRLSAAGKPGAPALVHAPVSAFALLERAVSLSPSGARRCYVYCLRWEGGVASLPSLLTLACLFLLFVFLKERSLVGFFLGNKKQKQSTFPSKLHDLLSICTSEYSTKIHVLIIVHKLRVPFYPHFFTLLSFFSRVSEILFQSHGKMSLERSKALWF